MQVIGIIVAIIILSLMLFLHELGHFIAGLKLGFKVEEFSIFMGPRLLSWERNGIRYSLKAFPIGASVQFAGEYPEDEGDGYKLKKGDFYERPPFARLITLLAGPMMNIVTAVLIFAIMFAVLGFGTTTIGQVSRDSLAAAAGVKPGERITSFNGQNIGTDLDLQIELSVANKNQPIAMDTVLPDGQTRHYELKPGTVKRYAMGIVFSLKYPKPTIEDINTKLNPGASVFVLGDQITSVEGIPVTSENFRSIVQEHISAKPLKVTVIRGDKTLTLNVPTVASDEAMPLGIQLQANESPLQAIPYTFSFIGSYLKGTVRILGQVFAGRVSASDTLTGPVGIVDMFSGVVTADYQIGLKVQQMFRMFAIISLALGVSNLLPIPPLDGGQILLLALEKLRGKRLSLKAQNVVTIAGVVFVLALAVFALGFDVTRIVKRITSR